MLPRMMHNRLWFRLLAQTCPEALIPRCFLDQVFIKIRQEFVTQIRDKQHCSNPGHQQGQGHHLKDRTGIFPSAGCSSRNWQEASCRNQGSGQHRKCRGTPGMPGSFQPAIALFHFDRHHLNGNNGIINQQAKCQNQCT